MADELFQLGYFVKWHEILGLCGVLFAISEFMEKNKLRAYFFKFSGTASLVYRLFLLSLFLVVAANAIHLSQNIALPSVDLPEWCWLIAKNIPYLSAPGCWEIASLLSLSCCIFILLFVSIHNPVPKLKKNNYRILLDNLARTIVNDRSDESMSAVAAIVHENLDKIFQEASKYNDWWNVQGSSDTSPYHLHRVKGKNREMVARAVGFIKESMSDEAFCKYASRSSLFYVIGLFEKIQKYQLPDGCKLFLLSSLYRELFCNADSHLSRELDYRGLGVSKPLFSQIFSSLYLIHISNPYALTFFEYESRKDPCLVEKYTEGLQITLEEYFKQGNMWGVSNELRQALENLPQFMTSLCLDLKGLNNDKIYSNKHEKSLRCIGRFYQRLNYLIAGNEKICPWPGEHEIFVMKDSVTEAMAKSIFEYLDALTCLDNDDYARMLSCEVFWAIYPIGDKNPIQKNIANKILQLIKERIIENKRGFYSSMIRLMVNIYGFNIHNEQEEDNVIGKYLQQELRAGDLARLILMDSKKHLPSSYKADFKEHKIYNLNGDLIFEGAQLLL
ncbi:MAG TPA: hypothetical protein PLY88_00015 [Candidatus Omnitrophota bacterium]|nr:hypothetical protein [Candidatus Omnitrophota bacterium]